MEIQVRINGKDERLKSCTTLDTLISERGLVSDSLVVEHNGRIIKQADWPGVTLGQGDIIELLNFVGGG